MQTNRNGPLKMPQAAPAIKKTRTDAVTCRRSAIIFTLTGVLCLANLLLKFRLPPLPSVIDLMLGQMMAIQWFSIAYIHRQKLRKANAEGIIEEMTPDVDPFSRRDWLVSAGAALFLLVPVTLTAWIPHLWGISWLLSAALILGDALLWAVALITFGRVWRSSEQVSAQLVTAELEQCRPALRASATGAALPAPTYASQYEHTEINEQRLGR